MVLYLTVYNACQTGGSMTTSLQALRDRRDQLTASLAHVEDLRPGFLTARFRRCGKPNCHCAHKDSPGHGPSYSLTHRVAGKTVTQVIPKGAGSAFRFLHLQLPSEGQAVTRHSFQFRVDRPKLLGARPKIEFLKTNLSREAPI
jgi:hypothetical protein